MILHKIKNYILLILLLFTSAYLYLAYAEENNNQFHVTIMGAKNNPSAKILYDTAILYAPKEAIIAWRDGHEKDLPKTTLKYPMLSKPAAYVCMKYKCSLPAFTAPQLQKIIQHFIEISKSSEQSKIQMALHSKNLWIIMPLFWLFGLLLSVTPCVLPIMLIITSILGGQSSTLSTRKSLMLSIIYILSLAITYAVAGIIVATFGFYLQGYLQNHWVIAAFSMLFIILGISLFGFINIQLPSSWRKAAAHYIKARQSGSYIGVAVMGVLATLIASPCVAAPLAGILAYIAESGDATLGAAALFATGIGIGTPIIIVGTLGIGLLQKAGERQKYIKQFFGILMLGIAIWLLARILTPQFIMFLWAGLAIFAAVYMGVLESQSQYATKENTVDKTAALFVSSLSKMISIMIFMYGGALLVGAIMGNTNPLAPLRNEISIVESKNLITLSSFSHVKNITEFNKAFNSAKLLHKPVLLLFISSWCTGCKELEENVFPDKNIQNLFKNYFLLFVDLSNQATEDINLAHYFNVAGPPVILLFDSKEPILKDRLEGDITLEKLTSALNARS